MQYKKYSVLSIKKNSGTVPDVSKVQIAKDYPHDVVDGNQYTSVKVKNIPPNMETDLEYWRYDPDMIVYFCHIR